MKITVNPQKMPAEPPLPVYRGLSQRGYFTKGHLLAAGDRRRKVYCLRQVHEILSQGRVLKGYSLLFIYDVRKDLPMMKITEALKARRSYYAINRELPVAIDRVMDMVKELTELVPDAFNMKSSRVAVVHEGKSRISSGTKSMTFLKVRLPRKN